MWRISENKKKNAYIQRVELSAGDFIQTPR